MVYIGKHKDHQAQLAAIWMHEQTIVITIGVSIMTKGRAI